MGCTLPHWVHFFHIAIDDPTYGEKGRENLPWGKPLSSLGDTSSLNFANLNNGKDEGKLMEVGSFPQGGTKEGVQDIIGNAGEMVYYLYTEKPSLFGMPRNSMITSI